MRTAVVLALVAPLLVGACTRQAAREAPAGENLEEARRLIEQGDYDAAITRLGSADDAESLFLLGRAWAGKAGATPPLPGEPLGLEEQRALDFLERAAAARPGRAGTHLAIAELLAPHARAGDQGAAGTLSPERVLKAYGAAIQADPSSTEAVEALIAFAVRMGRLSEAEAGFEELTRRDRENPEILVRFGDFLAGPKGDPEAALGVYAQALMWRPDDAQTRLKIAALHLDAAEAHLKLNQYAQAEARLQEARKYAAPGTPQATRLEATERALAEATGRR
jgi:tetratricopeptide (TPR) repeat protein